MIPVIAVNLDFDYENLPTKTFKIDLKNKIINDFCDEQEAMKQVIYLILHTERFQHIIYSWDYGIELLDLYGREPEYVASEIKRRITEALTQDERITVVDNFEFEVTGSKMSVTFVVSTIFGEVESEMVVA